MGNQIATIASVIRTIRRQKVILDSDLARIYGVPTKALNRAVKRNLARFPDDFIFQLTWKELENLKYQFGTSSFHGGKTQAPLRLYRKRGHHGGQCPQQPGSRADERVCGAGIRADA